MEIGGHTCAHLRLGSSMEDAPETLAVSGDKHQRWSRKEALVSFLLLSPARPGRDPGGGS